MAVPVAGHNASRTDLPTAKHFWTGLCSPYATHLQGHVPLLPTHVQGCVPLLPHVQGRVPLLPHVQGRVPLLPHVQGCVPLLPHVQGRVPLLPTHVQGRVPLLPHMCRAVFPSCHTCRAVFPSCHTCRAVFPSCHTHWQDRVPPLMLHTPLSHTPAGSCFLYATRSLCLLLYHRVKPSFIYPPLLVSVRGSGFHSTRQLTDLKGGVPYGLMLHRYIYEGFSPLPLAATLAGQAGKPTQMLTIMKGGLHPADSSFIPPPFLQDPRGSP